MYDHLSALAQSLGRYMAEKCLDGLPGNFGDDLVDAFPSEKVKSIETALAELKIDGLVKLSPVIGPALPRVRTTTALFVACDAAITGNDPVADSVALAELLVATPDLGNPTSRLHTASGWDGRRFNPAFALLMPEFADNHVRKVIQHEYPTMGVGVGADDVIRLSRYIERHR